MHTERHWETVNEVFPSLTTRELKLRANAYDSVYLNASSKESALYAAGSTVELTHRVRAPVC